jgi:hypothetical protein
MLEDDPSYLGYCQLEEPLGKKDCPYYKHWKEENDEVEINKEDMLLPVNHSYAPELLEKIVDGDKKLIELCHRCGENRALHIDEIISFDGARGIVR